MTKVATGHFNMSKSDKGSFLFNTVQALQRMQKKSSTWKTPADGVFFSLPRTLSDEFPGTLV